MTEARPTRSRRSSAFLSIVVVGLGIQVLNVASGPLVAHMLGPVGRGQLATVMVVALLCSQIGFGGFPAAVSHAVATAAAPARDVLAGLQGRGHLLALAASTAAAVLAAVLLAGTSDVELLVVSAFVVTYVTAWQFVVIAMLLGEGHVSHVNLLRLTATVLYVGTIVAVFVLHRTDDPAVVILVSGSALAAGLAVGWSRLDRRTYDAAVRTSRVDLRAFARRSFVSGIGALDSLGIDQVIVGVVLGQASLGLYAVAFSVTSLPLLVLHGVGAALLPRMATRTGADGVRLLRRWFAASVLIDLVLVVGLLLVVGPAIRIAFGDAFVPAIPTARILVVAWALLALRRVLTGAAQAQGRARAASVSELVSAGLMAVLVAIGCRVGDIEGAATGLAVAAGISCAWLALVVRWRLPAER